MRSKLARFAENAQRKNVVEPGKPIFTSIRGNWHSYFENDHPIILELGCGHGEYTVGLATLHHQKNFIGVDVKGARIWKGSRDAEVLQLTNAAFLRIRILQLTESFAEQEVAGIWITFPDPHPKEKEEKRRLTSPRFLEMYKQVMQPGSWVHLKTDNLALYEYSREVLKEREDVHNVICTDDLYHSDLYGLEQQIETTYERKFARRGIPIKYLRFQFQ
ncbi:tRNA (guanosine(46)-N7)-methyltransferase TrmB [Tunicatimonas pelagia]|uniref:tRNA (guanosine(46)-N7)-methyltransferase TrmB n=1 Tax=Tunicatimonas pelagia TaxID=931531 RepID=UPI0026660CE3|nr:tRNA (guanosine(46)-N7)-methyltransferase TrmB [Tunicatimonas pelagia]WKN43651.1 tRNA (guanosine(46)-N7)-methyltransferase TrmB [Tunicatimonas pelagia]